MLVWLDKEETRTLGHFVNGSVHSSTGYLPPLAAGPIRVDLAGTLALARACRPLAVEPLSTRTRFTLPSVQDYEVVVLE